MVLISLELLGRCINVSKRRKGESVDRYLRRATHLHLNERRIEKISNLDSCSSLAVLYLYENDVRKIENLEPMSLLTNLYLQNNCIERMENLQDLQHLAKLYLGHNCITLVEGVSDLPELRELHLEYQQLPPGEQILFDPLCMYHLASTLTVLNISGNGLTDLQPIACLQELLCLVAANNRLTDLKDVVLTVRNWPYLERLDFSGNPLCTQSRYRDNIICAAPKLVLLDSKDIQPHMRQFVQRWMASKERRRRQEEKDAEMRGAYGGAATATGHMTQMYNGGGSMLPMAPGSASAMGASSGSLWAPPERPPIRSAASNAVHEARTRFPDIFAPSRTLRGNDRPGKGSTGRKYESELVTATKAGVSVRTFPPQPHLPLTTRR